MHAAACPVFDLCGDIVAALAFTTLKDGNTETWKHKRNGRPDQSDERMRGADCAGDPIK